MSSCNKKRKLAQSKLQYDGILADVFAFLSRYDLEVPLRLTCRRFAAIIDGKRFSSGQCDESSPPPYHVLDSLSINDFSDKKYTSIYLNNTCMTHQDFCDHFGTNIRLPNYVRIRRVSFFMLYF